MKPNGNATSTERSQAILAAMQEEMRRVVLGEMRPADQLNAVGGRGTNEIGHDLDKRAADDRDSPLGIRWLMKIRSGLSGLRSDRLGSGIHQKLCLLRGCS